MNARNNYEANLHIEDWTEKINVGGSFILSDLDYWVLKKCQELEIIPKQISSVIVRCDAILATYIANCLRKYIPISHMSIVFDIPEELFGKLKIEYRNWYLQQQETLNWKARYRSGAKILDTYIWKGGKPWTL